MEGFASGCYELCGFVEAEKSQDGNDRTAYAEDYTLTFVSLWFR